MSGIQIATLVILNIAIMLNVYEIGKRNGRKEIATVVTRVLNATLKGLENATKGESNDE